jgi:hypothetical protein
MVSGLVVLGLPFESVELYNLPGGRGGLRRDRLPSLPPTTLGVSLESRWPQRTATRLKVEDLRARWGAPFEVPAP